MGDKILIVEDQWIEANDLQIILESSGFAVTGIAKSVDQAIRLLNDERPDMVLLDIFLKGDLTGIDLAKTLAAMRIPFIYLTANSDATTLEAAKATQPYGFLVKPYRERDILVALDIAGYRYKNQRELIARQEQWLSNMLQNITTSNESQEDNLIQLAKAFEPIIPLCFMMVDLNIRQDSMGGTWLLERSGYDEFKLMSGWDVLEEVSLNSKEYIKFRKAILDQDQVSTDSYFSSDDRDAVGVFPNKLKEKYKVLSSLYIPVLGKNDSLAYISFFSTLDNGFNNDHIEFARSVLPVLQDVIQHIDTAGGTQPTGNKVSQVNRNAPKQSQVEGVVGKSAKLLEVLALVGQVAPVDTTVLISGETGVGKEGLANGIHMLSDRKSKPFIKINCAAIPSSLIESELFGHERGSYTGASERRVGKFEQANGGTIFLDEVGEIPLDVQSKLLRVLQEKELERIGGRTTIKVDVRIIAATNRNLYMEVAAGRFRIDLYYRLNVFPILLPPLRERKEDIPLLADHFLRQSAESSGGKPKKLSPGVMEQLKNYNWPGNIRELQNLIERQVLMTGDLIITDIDLPKDELIVEKPKKLTEQDIAANEKEKIESALKKTNGKISGTGGAASILGMTPAVLSSRMRKLGIVWKYNFQ